MIIITRWCCRPVPLQRAPPQFQPLPRLSTQEPMLSTIECVLPEHRLKYIPPYMDNIYNVVIRFGQSFISLGECVVNCKCYLIQRILSPGKVKVRSVLKLWSIFTLLSDLENAVIWSSQIDHSFGTRFFHYGFSFNSNSVVSVSYLVYVCYGPWLYRPWGRSADGREADGRGGWDRDPRS